MCPIETPEGPNIGLINYLASYAKINEYGFIEAPFRKVDKADAARSPNEVEYMTADVEDDYYVAQAAEPLDEEGKFVNARVTCRHRDEIISVERELIDYVDVAPNMMTSIATAFIPFLENDDANRALMGANMQRQAVPLMVTEAPIVATGIEHKCAVDSEVCITAKGRRRRYESFAQTACPSAMTTATPPTIRLPSLHAPTRAPASTSARSSRSASVWKRGRSSQTVLPARRAKLPSARTS